MERKDWEREACWRVSGVRVNKGKQAERNKRKWRMGKRRERELKEAWKGRDTDEKQKGRLV